MLRQCIIPRACLRASARPNSTSLPALFLCQFQSDRRTLRTSGPPDSATPLPITAHGPPPKPPLPAPGEIKEMRKKQRERAAAAELGGQAAESAAPDPAAEGNTAVPPPPPPPPGTGSSGKPKPKIGLDMKEPPAAVRPKLSTGPGSGKRFWKESWVKEMPDGTKAHLAQLIAHEWNLLTTAAQATRAYLLPITSLASRVIDLPHTGNYEKARKDMVDMCMKYLDTDTLLCLHPPPNMYMMSEHVGEDRGNGENTLRGRQLKVLADTLTWVEENVFPGIVVHPLDTAQGFLATTPQPQVTKERIRKWIEERDDWELVGLERCVVSAKSLLVGVRLVAGWGGLHDKPISSTTPKEEREEGVDRETSGISQMKDTALRNRGTNTELSSDAEEKKRVRAGEKEETWGIEEAAQAATLEVSWQTGQWGEVEDTHDVEKEDVRRGLGAGWCLAINS